MFTHPGFNLKAAELTSILKLYPYDLDNPKRYQQLMEVLSYYENAKNMRYDVLKALQGKPGDALDTLWGYVALRRAKQEHLKSLDPADFAPDIENMLKEGVLTRDGISRVKKSVASELSQIAKQKAKQQQEELTHQARVDRALDKVDRVTKLQDVKRKLDQVEEINTILEKYG